MNMIEIKDFMAKAIENTKDENTLKILEVLNAALIPMMEEVRQIRHIVSSIK